MRIASVFRWALLVSSLSGILLQLFLIGDVRAALNVFSYYTVQTNLFVAIVIALEIALNSRRVGDHEILRILTGGVTLWIIVTASVYHFLLSSFYRPSGLALLANVLLHYVTPLLMMIYWLFFEKKVRYRSFYPLIWAFYPLLYALVSIVRGTITGFYPYWFLNPGAPYPSGIGSIWNLLLFILVVSAIFVAFGYLFVFNKGLVKGKFKSGRAVIGG